MSFRELRQMALDYKLLGHHKVWKDGSDERLPASSIVGLIPQKNTTTDPPSSDLSDDKPYAPPKTRTITEGPPGGLYLPHLRHSSFLVFFLVLAAAIGLAVGGSQTSHPILQLSLLFLSGLSFVSWIALGVTYLHRAWEMMHMFGAPFNGSKAVRFLFLPIFNALWCFVVLFGWAKLWNHSVNNHPGLSLASRVWRPSFFLFPIFFLAAQTLLVIHLVTKDWPTNINNPDHQVSFLIFGICLLLALLCWFQLCRSINFLARKKI